ncbi:hypothetical protein GUITHDRAFT_121989 [Guillardia theta CCMP2712]|uniref:Uncharacterized protein n=1 Tax=Guillardia theta (strain CCMP2712) TaxID=905079 RepID=L1I7H4_GUITC|nr:hypothetical protein GUITHDRAFT_121989 [Guillardia theta CCMP2712]EKX31829.1 hypothetical protein GUITHDRAFT_121989 [Guillardia theta CCMP2712]|eukprot:XP_005818809.1 hypothetical protein GUITHDRAFT_121989 [Guillardia theta CCMP2712]
MAAHRQTVDAEGMIGLGGDSQAQAGTSAAGKQTTAPGADVGDYLHTAMSSLLESVSGAFRPVLKSEDKKKARKKKPQLTIRLDTDVSLHEEASSDRQAGSGRSHKSALRSPMPASPQSLSLPSPLEKKKIRFMDEPPETSRSPSNALKTSLAETRTSDQRIARYEVLQPCTDKTGKSRNDAATAAGFNPIAAQGRRGSEGGQSSIRRNSNVQLTKQVQEAVELHLNQEKLKATKNRLPDGVCPDVQNGVLWT